MMASAVAAMALGELLGPVAGPHAGLMVSDLVSDSRQATSGAAFIALQGERSHGLDFAAGALAKGAAIVLYEPPSAAGAVPAEAVALAGRALAIPGLKERLGEFGARFYGSAEPAAGLIGVTGTNGKTTVAWLIAQAFSDLGQSCGYVGTLGFGMPGKVEAHAFTTPDCLTLHRELASLGTARAAIEVSSHALSQDRVAGLRFATAAFTNLSRDHLDWHKTMEAYFEAKALLFVRPELESAVINLGDAYGATLAARLAPTVRKVTVALGTATGATIEASATSRGLAGQSLELRGSFGAARIESPLIGSINSENLLVTLGVVVASGVPLDQAAAVLGRVRPPPGRLEVFGGPPDRPWVVVDYAHTPDALERVLSALRAIATGEITCVFGCGGDRDRGKRAPMGAAAARYAAHIVLTDDNPRSENPASIVADIKAGIPRHPDLRIVHSRDRAIAGAVAAAGPGDVVLVAGKGHETTQLIGAEVRTFEDRASVLRALEGVS
jgi:UDP-N-acetylmuramoyl-L-alanyl-D-glutamate--2,6-diaminopimelate ligase